MKRLGAVLFVGLLLVVGGCKNEASGPTTAAYEAAKTKVLAQPKEAPGSGKQAAAATPVETPAAAATVQASAARDYIYDPTGKKDPFRSFILDRLNEEGKQAKGPLEEYDLSQLAVVGVVWDAERPRALVEDPSGRGYVVQEGTAMGTMITGNLTGWAVGAFSSGVIASFEIRAPFYVATVLLVAVTSLLSYQLAIARRQTGASPVAVRSEG